MSVTIHLIAAARPNFMKVAPLYHALKATDWAEPVLVHTGQHYDRNMSDAILEGLVVFLFFVHHHLGIFPSFAAFLGLALALALLRPRPEDLFGEVNWSVLVFFAGLFVIVGGVESSGLLDLLGRQLAAMAADPARLLLACLALMWIAAAMSAVVDNIPFTVTMIPIILGLEASGTQITPLWWALAIGVGLGGNSTHIGATANLIAVTEAERSGIPGARITPLAWMRIGIPTTLLGLTMASIIYVAFFEQFAA